MRGVVMADRWAAVQQAAGGEQHEADMRAVRRPSFRPEAEAQRRAKKRQISESETCLFIKNPMNKETSGMSIKHSD